MVLISAAADHSIPVHAYLFLCLQIKDRKPEEALAFGRDFLGTAVKTPSEQSLLQVKKACLNRAYASLKSLLQGHVSTVKAVDKQDFLSMRKLRC